MTVARIVKTDPKNFEFRFQAKLNHKFTPIDLLFKYSKVYHVNLKDHSMITEVPKKVRDLDEALGLYMFPKMIRS